MKRTKKVPKDIITVSKEHALQIFSSNAFLTINKTVLKLHGPLNAIFLSNLVDKYRYFESQNMLDGNWFFLTHENQTNQTGISEYDLRKCKKYFKELGIIRTDMKGLPAKEWYYLDWEKLVEHYNKLLTDIKTVRTSPMDFKGQAFGILKGYLRKTNIKENRDVDSKESYDLADHGNELLKEINEIILHWNELPNTVSHNTNEVSPSNVYKTLLIQLCNLLTGLPIDCKKNQEPSKPFEEFCYLNQISETLSSKQWSSDEIKQVLTQIAEQHKGEKSLSLDSVLWSRFGKRGKGASPFLIYASESFVDKKYKKLVSILVKAHPTNNLAKRIQWARQFESEIYSENLKYDEVKELLQWYIKHYKNKYVPLCDDPFSFIDHIESLKNMKRNMAQKDKPKKTSIGYKEGYFDKNKPNIEID